MYNTYEWKITDLNDVSFWPIDGILFQEHPFSSSSNNHLTWQRSISLCTCASSSKCLDGSTPHVSRSRHRNLVERNPGVKIKSAFSATYCTPALHTNPSDLGQVLRNLQLWNFPENHSKPFQRIAMLLSPCHLTLLILSGKWAWGIFNISTWMQDPSYPKPLQNFS